MRRWWWRLRELMFGPGHARNWQHDCDDSDCCPYHSSWYSGPA